MNAVGDNLTDKYVVFTHPEGPPGKSNLSVSTVSPKNTANTPVPRKSNRAYTLMYSLYHIHQAVITIEDYSSDGNLLDAYQLCVTNKRRRRMQTRKSRYLHDHTKQEWCDTATKFALKAEISNVSTTSSKD